MKTPGMRSKLASNSRALLALLVLFGSSCDDAKKIEDAAGAPGSQVQAAFNLTASTYKLPARLLVAAGILESRLNPNKASAIYSNAETSEKTVSLGFSLTETAFGISKTKLALADDADSNVLERQIEAYGKYVRTQLDTAKISLPPSPANAGDKVQWILQLAQLHRDGGPQRRNVRVLFAKEMIDILNKGYIWQDPRNGQTLTLEKEGQAIDINKLRDNDQKQFTLYSDSAQISVARKFEINGDLSTQTKNHPDHIEVIHCPLTLSACLEIQNPTLDTDKVRLGAHYVIPQDGSMVERPIQITDHENVVTLTNNVGDPVMVQDAIVIMLVGQSGRYVQGKRIAADPTWITPWQLSRLGAIVSTLCSNTLPQMNPDIKPEQCLSQTDHHGVTFKHQGPAESYFWGDIPDYDDTIFWAYLQARDNMATGEATLETTDKRITYNAHEQFTLTAQFPVAAKRVYLERAYRCSDNKFIWATIANEDVLSATQLSFQQNIWDAGPNDNGRQFYRVMVYGDDNELLGWSIKDIYLKGFDTKSSAAPKECRIKGT